MNALNRRGFLRVTASAAGGMVLGFHLPGCSRDEAPASVSGGEVNAWLRLDADGSVLIRVAQSDMGQGVFTSLPMIVAEELEVDWATVRAEYASANRQVRGDKPYQRMGTGGSRAVRHSRPYLQAAGASARERLRLAAAARWKAPVAECVARAGRIHHESSARSLGYGELAAEAAALSFDDAAVTIRDPAAFRLIGTPTRRIDVPDKVKGATVYGTDVRLPGLLYAAVAHCPVPGGTLAGHEAGAIAQLRGVVQTVALDDAVAVVADSWWRASRALAALPVQWNHGPGAGTTSDAWEKEYADALAAEGMVAASEGDVAAAFAGATTLVEADYSVPYLAHACMEPMNCTVQIADGKLELWTGTQNPEGALRAAAETAGMDPASCEVHSCMLGGGFGRRSYPDFVREAVTIAKAVGKPVQTLWSREEDTRRGCYRPMAAWRFKAGLDVENRASAFQSQSIAHAIALSNKGDPGVLDESSVEGIANLPYAVGARRITHTMTRSHLHTWYWRSVGSSQNAWALECFIDEMAVAAQRDPIEFRRELLAGRKDFLRVLDVLAEKSGWGREMPAGSAQGMAIHEAFGTIVGQVAEVTVSRAGELRIERIVAAVDCGHVVNPLTVAEQIESGVVYGLSAALYGKLTVKDGAVVESNFHDYPVMRLHETPRVETHLALSGGDKWGGMGEPGLPPAAPAVCNAVFRVTGKRIRRLPLAGQDLSWGAS